MNTPGGNTTSAAELAFSLIMAMARALPQASRSVKAGLWERKKFVGSELHGKTVGVVGLGRIGREVAGWCSNFGMEVVGYDPILSESAARASNIELVSLEQLYSRCDFISLHTPLTHETRNMLNASTLAMCKPGVRIVNCARGGIIEEEALLDALNSGHVAGAALDVFRTEPPGEDMAELVKHPNVICTPHLGASTSDAQVRVARDIATQFADALEHGMFSGVVNAPNIDFARRSQLLPFTALAESLGSLHGQLLAGDKLKKIVVSLQGRELAVPEMTELITSAVLKGTLANMLEEEVNFVNAGAIAEEMGINVSEQRESDFSGGDYKNRLTVTFELDSGSRSLTGTVFGAGSLRLVQVDDYKVDILPSGNFIIFKNEDKPGKLRQITHILSDMNHNIGTFSLGRTGITGSQAMGFVSVDERVSETTLDYIRAIDGVSDVRYVELEEPTDILGFKSFQEAAGSDPKGAKPSVYPGDPNFSSGPCKKRPGYSLAKLPTDCLGRSHRSKLGKARLKLAITESKRILGVPDDYVLGIVPASDTGAFEMAMWSMLGPRGVDVCHWESFGKGWYGDITQHLKLGDMVPVNEFTAPYGQLPDLAATNPNHDIIFTWNGTTSGVRVPNGDWIPDNREGLTFCDATSAAFAMDLPWDKLDVVTYSWQKVLGGEGAHGVLVLSPRAVERLETFTPDNRPLPKIFRMTKKGKLDRALFEGATINTPSMLVVEDYLDAMAWAEREGGVPGLERRCANNLAALSAFVDETPWISFLAEDEASRSATSVCLMLDLPADKVKEFTTLLEREGVAYDIGSYRDAPPGLRIWCGATVDSSDVQALIPWLQWAYNEVKEE